MNITIPLLPVQKEFLQSTEPFVAIVSARSCGKTWVAVLDALLEVMRGNNVLYMCQNDGSWYKGGWVHLQTFLREWNLLDAWVSKSFENGEFGLVHVSWDKYGIRSDDMLEGKDAMRLRDLAVKAYTTPVKSCTAK